MNARLVLVTKRSLGFNALATSDLERKSQQVKSDLRRFSAEESIRLAEEMLRQEVNADTDAKLVKAGIDKLGGLN